MNGTTAPPAPVRPGASIPHQLQDPAFRFIRLGGRSKAAIDGWKVHQYPYSDPRIIEHIAAGQNYAVVTGAGRLCCFDADNLTVLEEIGALDPFKDTFTISTGKGRHYYFTSGYEGKTTFKDPNDIWVQYGDIRGGPKYYLVGPGSIHPVTGKIYEVINPAPILEIPAETITALIDTVSRRLAERKVQHIEIKTGIPPTVHRGNKTGITDSFGLRVEDFLMPNNPTRRGDEIQGAHPVHGSETGQNLCINTAKGLWHCFRCDSGGDAAAAAAVHYGLIDCADARAGGIATEIGRKLARRLEQEGYINTKRTRTRPLAEGTPGGQQGETATETRPGFSIDNRVKRIREVKDKKGEVIGQIAYLDNQEFVACMVEKYHCVSVAGNVWIYTDGYYRPDKGEIQAELSQVVREIGLQHQSDIQKEVKPMLAGTNFYRDSPFNYKMGVIPARNGVIHIDFETGEVSGPHPHSPDNLFTYCLPIDYDPAAPVEPVLKLFREWVSEQDVPILAQFPAQGFLQSMIDASYKKSYLFQGETNSAKSSYFELIYRTVGDRDGTISHISIHAMCERPFALYEMENRILNIYDDLDGSELTNHGRFKNITGNTHHQIERKHVSGYNGRIFCAHGFSCNVPPKIPDKIKFDPAFWDRWEYTVFPNEFAKDPKFYDRTYTPELLSGFLNLIIKSIIDIHANDNLVQNSTYDQVMEKWLQDSDPLLQFIDETTTESERLQNFSKARFFKAYSEWFDQQDFSPRRKITTLKKFCRDIQPHGFLSTKCTIRSAKGKKKIRVPCLTANRVWGAGHLQMEATEEDAGQVQVGGAGDQP